MNKTLVVTGGSKGIGKAILLKFASQGFDVITASSQQKNLDLLNQEFHKLGFNSKLYTYQADLSIKTQVSDFVDFINKKFTNIDVLINNTGIYIPGQINNEADGVLEQMINTNLYSAYHLTRPIVQKMIEIKSGHVFNICSTASITPYVNGGSYCISKYALLGMTKVLREELKPFNIRVTAVLPGATLTSSWEGVDLPESRFISPNDIAESIFGVYNLSSYTVVEEILIRPQLGDVV